MHALLYMYAGHLLTHLLVLYKILVFVYIVMILMCSSLGKCISRRFNVVFMYRLLP